MFSSFKENKYAALLEDKENLEGKWAKICIEISVVLFVFYLKNNQ